MMLARAKRLDNSEWVEGYLSPANLSGTFSIVQAHPTLFHPMTYRPIDPSTLELSFNGTDWFDVTTIKEALTKQVPNEVCKNCKYLGDEILSSNPEKRECLNPESDYIYLYQNEIGEATCGKFEPKTLEDKGD